MAIFANVSIPAPSVTVRSLKMGEYFTRKNIANPLDSQVYVRGEYDREQKRFMCYHWDDINKVVYLKGDTVVYTDFEF